MSSFDERLDRHLENVERVTSQARARLAAMTLKEAAAALGVTPDNLRGAIHRGALKATKMGRDWFVKPSEVERYRREHRRGS